MNKQDVWKEIEQEAEKFYEAADCIWDYAETAFQEEGSSRVLINLLKEEGFEVEENLADIRTAFKGTFGLGKPVIGILGEFDALSGMNQVANLTERKAAVPGAAGHGCGHHLFGAGSLAAAVGVKRYLEQTGKSGTVVYFGCPGEEGGSGKAFMAKKGAFEGLDAAVAWHPNDVTYVCTSDNLANYQVFYRFHGVSAHAGSTPHLGRSALDAVELMNVGVQFLREHMIPEARIHYAITNTGGFSPNVVQPYSEVLYLIRAPRASQVEELYQRVNKIAQGAALMTETEVEIDFVKGCSNLVTNKVIAKRLWDNLTEIGFPEYTEEEYDFAKAIHDSIEEKGFESMDRAFGTGSQAEKRRLQAEYKEAPIFEFITPFDPNGVFDTSSTDVGDVSWNCPTAHVFVTTWAAMTPEHSWQVVAQGQSSMAHKGLLWAAKTVAGTVVDLIENPELLEAAKKEMQETLGGESYRCPIPNGCKPRIL